jgi:hypothetical protein
MMISNLWVDRLRDAVIQTPCLRKSEDQLDRHKNTSMNTLNKVFLTLRLLKKLYVPPALTISKYAF